MNNNTNNTNNTNNINKTRKIIINIAVLVFLALDFGTGLVNDTGIDLFKGVFIFIGPAVVEALDALMEAKENNESMTSIINIINIITLIVSFTLSLLALICAFNNVTAINFAAEIAIKITAGLYPIKIIAVIVYDFLH